MTKYRWLSPKYFIFFFLILAVTIPTAIIPDNLSNKLVAIFTGLLAIATFFLGYTTLATVKEGQAREKREKQENLLKEVIDWAEKVLLINDKIEKALDNKAVEYEVVIKKAFIESTRIELITAFNKELKNATHDTNIILARLLDIISKKIELTNTKDWIPNLVITKKVIEYEDILEQLSRSLNKIIEIAVNLNISILKQKVK